MVISLVCFLGYTLFWETMSVAEQLRGNKDESRKNYRRSLNWVSFVLLMICVICALLFKYFYMWWKIKAHNNRLHRTAKSGRLWLWRIHHLTFHWRRSRSFAAHEPGRSALIGVLVLNSVWQRWYCWQLRGKPQRKPVQVCQRLEFKDFPGILVIISAFVGRFVRSNFFAIFIYDDSTFVLCSDLYGVDWSACHWIKEIYRLRRTTPCTGFAGSGQIGTYGVQC
jgi:hypothetical protein